MLNLNRFYGERYLRREALFSSPVRFRTDGNIPFRGSCEFLVPEKPGVYLLHDLRGVLYAGKSANLNRRFREHYWHPAEKIQRAMQHPFGKFSFRWSEIQDATERTALENSIILWLQPICNEHIPFLQINQGA